MIVSENKLIKENIKEKNGKESFKDQNQKVGSLQFEDKI